MSDNIFSIKVEDTKNRCPIGETVGERNIAENKIPVLSCEGACIRGEIARLAANMVAKEQPFARVCHGELLSVPDSAMARWVDLSKKVVLIDGCFIRCHGRILEDLVGKEKLVQFDYHTIKNILINLMFILSLKMSANKLLEMLQIGYSST